MTFKPVISVAIEPRSSETSSKLELAMQKIMEDPTIKVSEDPDTGQVILAGMGKSCKIYCRNCYFWTYSSEDKIP